MFSQDFFDSAAVCGGEHVSDGAGAEGCYGAIGGGGAGIGVEDGV